MASEKSDIRLLVVLAVLGYYAAGTVHKQLAGICKDSEITYHEEPPHVLGLGTVNALKLDTLGQLTRSPTPDIRAASTKIIIERLYQEDSTFHVLLQDLKSLDSERRDKALVTLRFISEFARDNVHARTLFTELHTIVAIVTCLMNLLPEAEKAETNSTYHPQAERDSIELLAFLLPIPDHQMVEKADVIANWLRVYPFGGRGSTLDEKKSIIRRLLMEEQIYEDVEFGHWMGILLTRSLNCDYLWKILQKHGLYEPKEREQEEVVEMVFEFNNPNPPGLQPEWYRIPLGAVRTSHGWILDNVEYPDETDVEDDWGLIPEGSIRTRGGIRTPSGARGVEQSPEEQRLRRRRREAMVLGENGRPIQRQDIIEPNAMNLDGENVDDELEPLMEEVARNADEEALAELRDENYNSWWTWLSRLRPDGLAPIYS